MAAALGLAEFESHTAVVKFRINRGAYHNDFKLIMHISADILFSKNVITIATQKLNATERLIA